MLVFISYPREFEAVASALDAELKSRKIDTFLDKEGINLTDVWKLEIESNIKKAGVFVILYLPEAATTGRYFSTEMERIQKECEKTFKKIIPVIFPPTKPGKLPAFFRNIQILKADAKGDIEDERDGRWIDKIVQEVERQNETEKIKEIEQRRQDEKKNNEIKIIQNKIKRRQIIARTAIAAGVIIIAVLYIKLIFTEDDLKKTQDELKEAQVALVRTPPKIDGESRCRSLVGSYKLHQNYVYTEGMNTRSIATRATTWEAAECEYNKSSDIFILKGTDVTYYDIEVIINGRYERIATISFIYPSEVYINNKDGKLLGRTFGFHDSPRKTKRRFDKDRNGTSLNITNSFIDKKINEVIDLRDERYKDLSTKNCTPTLGETGGRTAIAFICHDYTRVMVKTS